MSRFIGITHRRKQTREQEARPTKLAIYEDVGHSVEYDLETETHELDFLRGQLAVEWRKLEDGEEVTNWWSDENPNGIRLHQCKWKKLKREDWDKEFPAGRKEWRPDSKGKMLPHLLTHIPIRFDGLSKGDNVGMLLGGSGDRFAAALAKQGEKFKAFVYRMPPNNLKQLRGTGDKDDDHRLLAFLLFHQMQDNPNDVRPFYEIRPRDRALIRVKEVLRLRQQAMKDRVACSLRIQQAAIGRIFLCDEGMWPEGLVEDILKKELASDAILQGLEAEEARRHAELKKAVHQLDIWKQIFEPIEGCGERLAAGLIAAIGDIRRFWVDPDPEEMQRLYKESRKLEHDGKFEEDIRNVQGRITSSSNHFQVLQLVRSFKRKVGKEAEAQLLDRAVECHQLRAKLRHKALQKGEAKLSHFVGVFVKNGGKYGEVPPEKQFPRHRHGEGCNWNPEARQALFLLAEQFNRRPASEWGAKRIECKRRLRETHPEPVEVSRKNGEGTVKRYTDGHIHKMSAWSSLSKFVRHVFREWTRIEETALRREKGRK